MNRERGTYLALIAFLLLPIAANADPIKIEATSLYPSYLGDFFVIFDDTGDSLLQWDEIVEFSGLDVLFAGVFVDTIDIVPTILGISSSSWDPSLGFTPSSDTFWGISGPTAALSSGIGNWSYGLTAVPEPGTLALLGIGFLGMAAARRRRKI